MNEHVGGVPRRMPLALACGLFLVSGASGLIYEVVWMRQLSLVLSVTVYAVTTVLCAFMAGLALGASVGGPLADRVRSPLRAYGLVELALAASGLVIPWILFHLGPLWSALHHLLGGRGFAFGGMRFLVAFGVLLVPCTLMGMTLPILSRAAIDRREGATSGAGLLYAINTLGAVLGCFVAGFVLLRVLGLEETSAIAALGNLLVGAVAIAYGRGAVARAEVEAVPEPERAPPRLAVACVALAVSGFAALGYEVLWTRALVQFVHNSTYAYSAMLVVFLLGLAVGSAVASPVAERSRRPLLVLGLVEVGVAVSVVAGLLIYARFGEIVPEFVAATGGLGSWLRVVGLIFAEAGATMLATTFLLGMTFPLALRVVVTHVTSLGSRIGTIYAANTLGSILGAWLVGFVLLPWLGVRGAFLLLVVVNLALGGWLLALATRGATRLVLGGAVAAAAVLALTVVPPGLVEASFERQFGHLLFYHEDVTDTVMVTEHDGERMIRYGDGRGTAGTMTVREDRMYAHVAMLLHPDPRRVLSICFGVGNSLAGLVTYPMLERVDSVELSPSVVAAAPYFERTNHDVLAEPRVNLVIADGRNFLLTTDEVYDVIRLDPPELHTAGVVNLYTREFYQLARAHLAPGGIFSIWVNVVMTPVEDLRHLVRTVRSVFPYVSVWHGPLRYSWVINGSMEPHPPDLGRLQAYYRVPSVRADLEAIGVPDPYAFLQHFVFETHGADRFAGPGPLVTDDHTILDFTVPMSLDSAYGIANANTQSWLVDFMKPDAKGNVALQLFFSKIKEMAAFKEPVAPFVVNLEGAGIDRSTLEAELEHAPAG